jgi:3-hydroxyacyl-CoA dehydrogenase
MLFPFLFEAVRMIEATCLSAEDVDACMRLGAGHPMGPLKLLDFVGLDVAVSIGDSLHRDSGRESDQVPARLRELAAAGRLGRKSGSGFYDYD